MRVDPNNAATIKQTGVDGARKSKLVDKVDIQGVEPSMLKESSKVSLSDRAKNYAKIKKIADETPDVRQDKVAFYKELLKSGKYKVDSEKLADAMIEETIKNEVLTGEIL